MTATIHSSFEQQIIVLPLASITLLRQVPPAVANGRKYQKVAASIREVGLVEPLVVTRPKRMDDGYLLLDGYLRHRILLEQGQSEAKCLIAEDDEAFTYNKRINGLAPVQEHFMIVRALDRGVPEDRLAKALNVDIGIIRRRSMMLDRICPEVVEMLKDRSPTRSTFDVLRKMKPIRQIEVAEVMLTANNFSHGYSKALLAATRQTDLVRPDQPKKIAGLTSEQMARMEREMATLQQDFKEVEASYGDDVLHLVVATAYLSKLIGNATISRYLDRHHSDLLDQFKSIVAAGSLDQGSGGVTTSTPE
jgi:ParB-like chromosome segregation protein Spo0J